MKTLRLAALTVLILGSLPAGAQQTGSFEKMIPFNMGQKQLAYYVPATYDPAQSYCLVIGMEQVAVNMRNTLIQLADSIDAIIVCPDVSWSMTTGSAGPLIQLAIDTVLNEYSVDTGQVFLMGFSMYGYETFYSGFQSVYDFAGIIPLAAFLPAITSTTMNYNSGIPSCICSGTADGGYSKNLQVYDTLIAHGQQSLFNSWPGIGHTYSFPGFINEMLECFTYFDSINPPSTAGIEIPRPEIGLKTWPNPVSGMLSLSLDREQEYHRLLLTDLSGRILYERRLYGEQMLSIDVSSYVPGIYLVSAQGTMGDMTSKIIIN